MTLEIPWDDPVTAPFWEGAARHKLLIQHCEGCDRYQFYPRPFCIKCESDRLEWVEAAGTGTVYAQSEVHLKIVPNLEPPYVCALVDLDEGPRLLANIVNGKSEIGSVVRVTWREREGAPPLPVFEPD